MGEKVARAERWRAPSLQGVQEGGRVSPMGGQARLVCLEALRRGMIPPGQHDKAISLLESPSATCFDPQVLLEEGLLTREQLDALLADQAASTRAFPGGESESPAPAPTRPTFPCPFGDDYELLGLLGEGAMGQVYKAWQRSLRRHVALKVIRPAVALDPELLDRFQLEAQAAARLRHPNIVSVHHVGVHQGEPFFTMDLVDGSSLSQVIRAGRLSLTRSLELLEKVAHAIHAAHEEGIIHRDLKPGNILVDARGEPLVTDFGLAKDLETDFSLSLSSAVLGTPSYMSPEQAEGRSKEADARSDVYSLGAILYEMLVGRPPFQSGSLHELFRMIIQEDPVPPRRLNGAVPADVETICLKCLSKEPERRYRTAEALADDLRRYLAGEPVTARPSSVFYRTKKRLLRHKAAVAVAGVGLVAVVALLAGWITTLQGRTWEAEREREEAIRQREAAMRARGLAEDAHQVAMLYRGLTPPEQANLAEHVINLEQLHRFLSEQPKNAKLGEVADRCTREEAVLLQELHAALRRNDLAPIARLFAERPTFRSILERLGKREDSDQLLPQLRKLLELNLHMPPPVGKGQFTLDALGMVLALEPENRAGLAAQAGLRALKESMSPYYRENFDGYQIGERPSDWKQRYGVEETVVQLPSKALLVTSTDSTHGHAIRKAQASGAVVSLEIRIRFQMDDPGLREMFTGGVGFEGTTGICGFGVADGHFTHSVVKAGRSIPVKRKRAVLDRDYQVELRYFPRRGRYDVLIDGEFFVEEADVDVPQAPGQAVQFIRVGSIGKTKVYVDDLVLGTSNDPVVQELGEVIPLITLNKMKLRLARHLPLRHTKVVAADVNGDGITELVTGVPNPEGKGTLNFYHVTGKRFDWKLIHQEKRNSSAEYHPVGMVGKRLAIYKVLWWVPDEPGAEPAPGLDLLEVGQDFSLKTVLSKKYDKAYWGVVAPLNYGGGRRGFVVGLGPMARGFELFEEAPGPTDPPYTSRGFYQPGERLASDIVSIAPCDCDGDGGDDLFIGWSSWNHFCPGLAVLSGTHVASVRRLTEPVGDTDVAISNLGTGTPHLVSASGVPAGQRGRVYEGHGLRVWRIERGNVLLILHKPIDVRLATAGRVCGRDVFAVCQFIHSPGSTPQLRRGDLCVQTYGLEAGKIEKLWEARFFDIAFGEANLRYQLSFLDLNGDGEQELVACLGELGICIFSGLEGQR